MSWFTYEAHYGVGGGEGTQELGEPDHRWLTAQGPFQGNHAALDIWIAEGAHSMKRQERAVQRHVVFIVESL